MSCSSIVAGYYLEQSKVVFLDHTSKESGLNNFLFRGNEPKISVNGNDEFAYDLLKQYLTNASVTQANIQLPSDFYLIDIKYVYDTIDPFEKKDIKLEEHFFNSNPTLGEYYTHVILGDFDDPSTYSNNNNNNNATLTAKARALSQWQHDDLPGYIPTIKQFLYTKWAQPTVIYLHCECGCDRTGEVAASYAMKYLNQTYPDVIAWDDSIAGRPILPNHQLAIEWYCYYLSIVEGMQLNCK